jgi:type II secretory pathway predicted ATPase ExeA
MLQFKTFKQFGLTQDPFSGDVVQAEDVYLTEDTRFIAEYLVQAAKVGGMVALVGESGSGKTTIRRYAMDRMAAEGQKVRIIAPRCVDKTRLTTTTICDALITDCST